MRSNMAALRLTNLSELIDFMGTFQSILESNDQDRINEYLSVEYNYLNNLSIDQLNIYINVINTRVHNNGVSSLVNDLTNIYSANLILERLLLLLHIILHMKMKSITHNDISKDMLRGFQQEYFMVNNFEYNLREIYMYLLDKHIEASSKMNVDYTKQLHTLRDRLSIKYTIMGKNPFNQTVKDIQYYVHDIFFEEYLDKKIKEVIDILLSISDDALENESIYAFAMSHQILLRSLFVMLDDYKKLAEYEDYYNDKCKERNIARGIITSAFIANYHDLNEYSLSKTID